MASKVCSNVKNPSQKHRAAMAQLFPSSSTPKRPRISAAFDPTWQCVAFNQQSKKKAARVKPSKVKVMLVPNGSKSVPRGTHQLKLDEKKVEIFRTMSALEAKKAIVKAFTSQKLSSFIYLKVDNAQRFTKDITQDKDGNTLANIGRNGTVYIEEQTDVSTPSHIKLFNYLLSFLTCSICYPTIQ